MARLGCCPFNTAAKAFALEKFRMFRCDVCNKVLPAGTSQVKLVTETRQKTYEIAKKMSDKDIRRARRNGVDIGSSGRYAQGWEIQKEVTVCPDWKSCRPELVGVLEAQLAAHAAVDAVADQVASSESE